MRTSLITALLLIISLFGFSSAVSAQDKSDLCRGANLTFQKEVDGRTINCGTDAAGHAADNQSSLQGLINTIINVFSIIVGIVAVIMIIWGGFKFITSGGDSGKVTSARNTIIYAIIGLIIVALAQTIVKFVLSKI